MKDAAFKNPHICCGKPSAPMLTLGLDFFDPHKQDACLQENKRIYELYRRQPLRTACKNCGLAIAPATFIKYDISYHLCENCGHLSGAYEDTAEYYKALFTDNGGDFIARQYSAEDRQQYDCRVAEVYAPKVDFLHECLQRHGASVDDLSYADIGAGSGYLVSALLNAGCTRVRGYEASTRQVAFGNMMLGRKCLEPLDITGLEQMAADIDAHVVTLVFVLEHLLHPYRILESLSKNPAVRYILLAVPVHSLACYIELMFPSVFQRQLFTHTHLYSDKSLAWLC